MPNPGSTSCRNARDGNGSSSTWWTCSGPALEPSEWPSCRNRRDVSRSPFGSRMSSLSRRATMFRNPGAVFWIALEVRDVALNLPHVRRGVDVIDRAPDRRQPAGDVDLAQGVGEERQVGHRAEAAEALAQQAPPIDAELVTDQLRIANDRIRAEMRQVLGLRLRRGSRDVADRGRSAGAPLVQQQEPIVLEGALLPADRLRLRSGRLEARARPAGTAGTACPRRPERQPRG